MLSNKILILKMDEKEYKKCVLNELLSYLNFLTIKGNIFNVKRYIIWIS